ncbi:UNKNOWN [Stylonychia lemnae]|uniref:Uncharacterized protein n=1 Tax=Stylonychia lemnae TaxID=5949 RepID=A0A078AJS3_STYLE|nr:UNKNOWN [Stylonychia lemnae]|eukprot:CDW81717.1 UNKNOWN [Stylonychia lemnae]
MGFFYDQNLKQFQSLNKRAYLKIVPALIRFCKITQIKRLIMVRNNNKLVFFYPGVLATNHKFSDEFYLPFDEVLPQNIVDFDLERLVIFPRDPKEDLKKCYIYNILDDWHLKLLYPMKEKRNQTIFVKVLNSFIYAIGGNANGSCERLDVLGGQGINIDQKFIYVFFNQQVHGGLQIYRLNIEDQENDVDKPLIHVPKAKWIQISVRVPRKFLLCVLQQDQYANELIIFGRVQQYGHDFELSVVHYNDYYALRDAKESINNNWVQPQSFHHTIHRDKIYYAGSTILLQKIRNLNLKEFKIELNLQLERKNGSA